MIDPNSADARQARTLADAHLDKLFSGSTPPILAGHAATVETPRFSELVETLRKPIGGAELREGLLIQTCMTRALQSHPRFFVVGSRTVVVTDADRSMATGNVHADLNDLAPPPAGKAVDTFEIDLVAVERDSGELHLIDIKRSNRDISRDRDRLRAASLAARRLLKEDGLAHFRASVTRVRWFLPAAVSRPATVSRDTVDAAFGAPIREITDHALSHFREGLDRRLRALVDEIGGARGATAENVIRAFPRADAGTSSIDEAALLRAFGRGGSKQGGAR